MAKVLAKIQENLVAAVAIGFIIGGTLLSMLSSFSHNVVIPILGSMFGETDLNERVTVLVEPSIESLQGVVMPWGAFLAATINAVIVVGLTLAALKLYSSGKLSLSSPPPAKKSSSKKK